MCLASFPFFRGEGVSISLLIKKIDELILRSILRESGNQASFYFQGNGGQGRQRVGTALDIGRQGRAQTL